MSIVHQLARRVPIVVLLAALMVAGHTSPASAAGAASGSVRGTIAIGGSPVNGIPTDPGVASNTTFTFATEQVAVAFTNGVRTFEGTLNVTAYGGAIGETATSAAGWVGLDACSGVGISAPPLGPSTAGCTGSGSFTRAGTLVSVALNVVLCADLGTWCVTVALRMDAKLLPTNVDCFTLLATRAVPHCINGANLVGDFVGS